MARRHGSGRGRVAGQMVEEQGPYGSQEIEKKNGHVPHIRRQRCGGQDGHETDRVEMAIVAALMQREEFDAQQHDEKVDACGK